MKISIGLTFPGTLQDESIICYLCKKFDVSLNIIEASFSMDAGWSILTVEGQENEIKRAFEYLAEKGVKVQQIQIDKK
ncbi:MAG: NIL domain-containing protein [Candidatus Omnitrophica bacterium]|jgi:ABC-type methionine transport system ATPase subunit|nr:NIL domain-containing protein [Candidatus Omnitrophota bacterium]MDD5253265.1 NIL domain-containing protein [Candidatus Omnitrophota bacterium]